MGSLLAAVTLAVAFFASAAQAFTRSRFFCVHTAVAQEEAHFRRGFDDGYCTHAEVSKRFRSVLVRRCRCCVLRRGGRGLSHASTR